jgi:hypothetical protein
MCATEKVAKVVEKPSAIGDPKIGIWHLVGAHNESSI